MSFWLVVTSPENFGLLIANYWFASIKDCLMVLETGPENAKEISYLITS